VAALENRILMAVCPNEFLRLSPEYAKWNDSWQRLLAHEITHRFHVNLLHGNEDAMGPSWFYEGFAVFGAGQNLDEGLMYNSALEALSSVHEKGPLAYRRYVAAVRFFMQTKPLDKLIEHAGKPDFEDWLKASTVLSGQ
jgi:hypothetical protein